MIYTLTGDCPRCGAPIWATSSVVAKWEDQQMLDEPPGAHFTCECRLTMPKPLPDVSGIETSSTEDEDRKWLAKHRAPAEAPSVERAD